MDYLQFLNTPHNTQYTVVLYGIGLISVLAEFDMNIGRSTPSCSIGIGIEHEYVILGILIGYWAVVMSRLAVHEKAAAEHTETHKREHYELIVQNN